MADSVEQHQNAHCLLSDLRYTLRCMTRPCCKGFELETFALY